MLTRLYLTQPEPTMVTDTVTILDKAMEVWMLHIYHMIVYLLVVKRQCLLLSGDVELNPGPLDQGRLHTVNYHPYKLF